MDLVCYIPVEFLSVRTETNVVGIRLIPIDDPRIPKANPWFTREKPIGCVVAIDMEGTSYEQMAEEARAVASHVLRVLRVALREHREISYQQLRFRLSTAYAFDDQHSGWKQLENAAFDLTLDGELIDLIGSQPISTMPAKPSTGIEKAADRALRWMERAWFSGEPLVALLFLVFALEALLGDMSEKLKAHALALRQTMLSHIVTGEFTHPSETLFLYDKVRSQAVHGEDTPEVNRDIAQRFAWEVRHTLNQYLILAREQGFARRGRLLTVLDKHSDRPQVLNWLRHNGGHDWSKYLDELGAGAGEKGV